MAESSLVPAYSSASKVKILPKRKFAYVGFKSDDIAAEAVGYHDGTFIDTSKIEVF